MLVKDSLKILSVGNSFAEDTSEYVPEIALNLGVKRVHIGTLYIGGCSINRHYANAQTNAPAYTYYVNDGEGWSATSGVSIADAIKSEEWDYISIQHGTGDGSRYTLEESYEKLAPLVEYIREKSSPNVKIAFNMAWVMEPDGTHPEIRSYNGDQLLMYENLARITERVVMPTRGLDIISPAGTAIQNARATGRLGKLCRDGFHLSKAHGRYIAALTFLGKLTQENLDDVIFAPEGVSDEERKLAIECAKKAIKEPFRITQ
jgi:hypothetical protein